MDVDLFTAYFRKHDRSHGQSSIPVPPDGVYPQFLVWEEDIYQLWDTNYEAREGVYEYYGPTGNTPPYES